jgi:hypothetical protein
MLNVVVAIMVAQVLHKRPRPDEFRKDELLLDDLVLRWGQGISIVDDVEVILGEQVQLSNQLLGLNRRQIGARESLHDDAIWIWVIHYKTFTTRMRLGFFYGQFFHLSLEIWLWIFRFVFFKVFYMKFCSSLPLTCRCPCFDSKSLASDESLIR